MFLIIPLTLILASAIGISAVVYRKMPYLKKLSPEVGVPGGLLTEFLPELSDGFKVLKLAEHRDMWLVEAEKFLRRLRVVSLKMDRISDSMIKKIRNGNGSRMAVSPVIEKNEAPVPRVQVAQTTVEDPRKEEQKLIIEIAKNPKDAKLYETLSDLYIRMNNLSDAKESLDAAIELNPQSEALLKKRSQVLEKLVV